MAEGDGRSIFISYASNDAETANSACRYLEAHGINCWMAPRNVKPGAQYADAIVRAINEAAAMVVMMSASAMASSHVRREVERAAAKHKQIIAFRIDGAALNPALEYFLSESQWIDVPALGLEPALARLTSALGEAPAAAAGLAAPIAQHPSRTQSARLNRTTLILSAAAAAGVIAVAAYL